MSDRTITLSESAAAALDAAATAQQRDRNLIANEAVELYLSVDEYHRLEIESSLREADAGDLLDHAEVEKRFASRIAGAAVK